jgi:hypothetical protein
MSSPSLALPRGLVPGICFAVLLALPLFFAISLDSSKSSFSGRLRFGDHSLRQRPLTNAEFFDHQLAVQVFVGFRPGGAGSKPLRSFQIRVENRSSHELSVDVLEARSEFGDLSAGLQTIRLAPGQMTQTGVALKESSVPTKPSPVQVTLRLGNREEKRELILAPETAL